MTPGQGEIWWAEADFGRRPVLVVTRSQASSVLKRLLVAPITRTTRGIPTELALGLDEGLREPSVASFDNIALLSKSLFIRHLGTLAAQRRHEICDVLAAVADC